MKIRTGQFWLGMLVLLAIVFAGALLRYAFNEAAMNRGVVQGDAAEYIRYATNLLEYSTFSKDRQSQPPVPDAYWSPGYPAYIAATIRSAEALGVRSYQFLLNTQIALGVLTILLTYLLARTFLPSSWALLPAALVAFSPHLVAIGQNVLTETLFGFLLLLSLYLFTAGVRAQRKLVLLLAGVSLALSWLVNPVSVFVAPLLLLALFAKKSSDKNTRLSRLSLSALVILPLVLVMTAWNVRTSVSVPADSPSSSDRLLINLIIGMHSNYHALWREDRTNAENPAVRDQAVVDGSFAAFSELLAEKFIRNPMQMLKWYAIEKPLVLFGWEVQVGYRDIYIYFVEFPLYERAKLPLVSYVVMKHIHPLILIFAVLGIVTTVLDKREARWIPLSIYLCTAYISLVYIISQADPRYSFPLRPELYICATYFLWSAVHFIAKQRKNQI